MKKFITIFCALAFAICGLGLGLSTKSPPPIVIGNGLNMSAATPMKPFLPPMLERAKDSITVVSDTITVRDTVYVERSTSTVAKLKRAKGTTANKKKSPATSSISQQACIQVHDTVYLKQPVIYLAVKQVGMKEGPLEDSLSIYEVHKVDSIGSHKYNSPGE